MEMGIWEILKGVAAIIILPILGAFSYFFRKMVGDLEMLQVQITDLKIKQAVSESQIQDIREDIKGLVIILKEVEATIVSDIKDLQKDIRKSR